MTSTNLKPPRLFCTLQQQLISYITVIITVVEYIILIFPLTFILIYCEFTV